MSTDHTDPLALEREWTEWRSEHERRLGDPRGLMAATRTHWLTSEPTRFEDVPGTWSVNHDGVREDFADGEILTLGEETLSGTQCFGALDALGVSATFDDEVVEIAKRGDRVMIRPRHPNHELVRNYRGTPVDGLQHVYEAP